MGDAVPEQIESALALLPSRACVLTAAFDGDRSGMLVKGVIRCANEPPLVCVSAMRGHVIAPLIRDSHAFALCLIDPEDRLLIRKFGRTIDEDGDPFDSFDVRTLQTGAPTLAKSLAVLDCEVVRHFDMEADHELYIGQVVAAWMPNGEMPCSAEQPK